ncbi:MAG: hypothetical protein HRU09_00135 [Oligoflexales bacterium]|nr:hypothetical protein [Oligoflexales bacterium]
MQGLATIESEAINPDEIIEVKRLTESSRKLIRLEDLIKLKKWLDGVLSEVEVDEAS